MEEKMFHLKKKNYIKIASTLLLVAIILAFIIPNLGAKADTTAGESGESSAISSELSSKEETSSEETSSEEVISSEDTSSEAQIQSFGARAGVTNWDLGVQGPLTIASTDGDYVITGSYTGTSAGITVQSGYTGNITLNGVNIITTANAPAMILVSGSSVNLNLVGSNELYTGQNFDATSNTLDYAGLDVEMNATVTIDGTGSLHAKSGSFPKDSGKGWYTGAAGIGAGWNRANIGGNVVIKGGTVSAEGGYHGAGIGGGWTNNPTNVIVLGGNITSIGGNHAHGVGKGCAGNSGILVVLPPAVIDNASGGQGTVGGSSGGVAYLGDPNSPLANIQTEDFTPNADIYINFSSVSTIVNGLGIAGVDAAASASTPAGENTADKYYIGTTDSTGIFSLNANVSQNLTFFTDATTIDGKPYLSKVTNITANKDIILPRSDISVTTTLTSTAPTDIIYGNASGTPQNQTFRIENDSNVSLSDIAITLTGADASKFQIITTSIPTTLAAKTGTTAPFIDFTIRPISTTAAPLAVGTYNVSVKVTAKGQDGVGTAAVTVAIPDMTANALEQKVVKKAGTAGTDGKVEVTNLQPSGNWKNTASLDLKATPQISGDTVESWTYVVTTSPIAPAAGDPSWVTIAGGTATATYNFPANTDTTYYVHWTLETAYATGMCGTITDSSVQTYMIDLKKPEIQSITTGVTTVGTLPFPVTVTFTEEVDPIMAANIAVTNGSVTGTITAVGTPVGTRYTTYTFNVTPNAGLTEGQSLKVAIPANVTKDKANNGNLSSADSNNGAGGTNTDLNLSVSTSTPTAAYSYADQQVFITQPTATDIKVVLTANGKHNQILFKVGTTTEIDAVYAANFLQVNGTPVNGTTYSATMVKNGNNYEYTITSATGFLDGAFAVSIASNQVENSEGNKLQPSTQTFNVCIPKITGITTSTANMDYRAGTVVVTVQGVHLQYGTVEVYSSLDGQNHIATASADGTTAQFVVTLPENGDYVNPQNYTFSPLLNGAAESYSAGTSVYRKPSEIIFDVNGGDVSSKPADIVLDKDAPVDVSGVQVGAAGEPLYHGNVFMGWVYEDGTPVPDNFVMSPGSHKVIAQWLDLSKTLTSETVPDVVVKKDGATKESVEDTIGGMAEYTDAKGVVHRPKVDYTWDEKVLTEGGVIVIRPYIPDPKTGEPVYLEEITYLYVLNPPYIGGATYYVTFEGQSVPSDVFGVYAIGEEVDMATHTIKKVRIPVTYHGDGVDFQTSGLYGAYFTATFTDYFGDTYNLKHDVQIKVQKAAELSKEDQLKAESSEFWVKVASIYHRAKPGEIWEVTPNNYKEGGTLVSKGEIGSDAGYTYLVNVTVGKYVYMNPVVLDQVRTSTAGGQVNANLEGRQISINHADFATNPNRAVEPKGYFDLRMSVQKNEKVSALVGDQTQMQLHFDMNRAWLAEPYLTLKVSEELNSAAANGSTLYLFNYNANTNGLELVGPMIPGNNGNFRIQMKGVYGDYVILAGLPSGANYKVTEKTNTLSAGTVNEIGQNYVDSGKVLNLQEGLNAASTTRQNIKADEVFDSLKEYEAFTGEKISVEKNNNVMPILGGIIGVGAIAAGLFLWKKKQTDKES